MGSLKDKVAIITGASSGIGAGTAVELARYGARLVLHGRNEVNLRKTAQDCQSAGLSLDKILYVVADLSKDDELESVITKTIEHFGQLDILVNNAGQLIAGSLETTAGSVYDAMMDINSRSVYMLTHFAIPHLKKTKGSIVNVSSVCGTRAFNGVTAYCMSKAAVDQLTRCAALELAEYGVRVNAVNPGVIITELHKRGGMSEEAYVQFLENCKRTHPLGRPGEVKDVAQTIAHLASDASAFITGATIPIDGGLNAACPR